MKQRASTLRSVNRGFSAGRRGRSGFGGGGGGGVVVVGSVVGAGSVVAAGVVTAVGAGVAGQAGARWCFAGFAAVAGSVSASGFALPGAGPDTEYCHSQRGWWMCGGWLRNAVASDGEATTTPAASEAVQRIVRAMIRFMGLGGAGLVIVAAGPPLPTPSG